MVTGLPVAASTAVFFVHDVPSTVIVLVAAVNSAGSTLAVHTSRTLTLSMFTDADAQACELFAATNTKIRTIRLLYQKAPHLASKLRYSVRDALPTDYFIPDVLAHACKVVEISFTKDLCSALSCNPTTENGVCRPTAKASYYYVGDDGYDVQCQPACFNTAVRHTYAQDGSRAPDTPMLNYHSGKCRVVPANIVTFLEKPFFRSDTVYEYRKNDMPTGFSRTTADDNPYGCGLDYRNNAAYCKYYDRVLQEDGSCGLQWWETGLDAVVGMSLVNTVKSNVRVLHDGGRPFAAPDGLPELPAALEPRHTVDGWKSDVDPSFTVPELVDTRPVGVRRKRDVDVDVDGEKTASGDDWVRCMRDAMLSVLEQIMTDSSFWVQTGVGIVSEAALDTLKSLCKRIVEKVSLSLVKRVPLTFTSVGANVLKTGLKSACAKLVTDALVRTTSKTAIAIAKLTAAAVSVVGWLTMAATLLDVLFTVWDPYGYKNMFPPSLPHDMMAGGERTLRLLAGSPTVDYEFESLVSLLLTEDEIMNVHVESLRDRITYLDALTVNSEGTRIEKGPTIEFDGVCVQAVEQEHARVMLERVRFDPESYAEYNRDFMTRVMINEYTNYGAMATSCLTGLCTAFGFHLLGVLFFLLTLVALAAARLQLYDDTLLDYVKERRRPPTQPLT